MADDDRRAALTVVLANLARFHREHEKFYGEAPLRDAATLLRTVRTLQALAERWTSATPAPAVPSPFAGATDVNDERAIETGGVLFMESGEPPAEFARLVRDVETVAADAEASAAWLQEAMERSWDAAEALLDFPELADVLAARHAIIAHNWQNAVHGRLVARQLRRAAAILARVPVGVRELRAELAEHRHAPAQVMAAAELIDQAVDLVLLSSTLVRANEPHWRAFQRRLSELGASSPPVLAADSEPSGATTDEDGGLPPMAGGGAPA
jgi:hypothetical protein